MTKHFTAGTKLVVGGWGDGRRTVGRTWVGRAAAASVS